ncbi:hypothetical protein QR97_01695 [Streptomyces sp. PBH53]|uniref:hypothetical protein n=1 Tax=Streptomyces sp. PBH53 TaxID=1577075 RepID=UPI0006558C7E|nr:hypothetical protein [Streptomyces sp. PBH53]AKN68689.1 hypothetical protein QR97_01695 [Streptomyces sp. PBH53]
MKADDIRLSYTDPITGRRARPTDGLQYVEIDDVVLVVRHLYRARHPDWSARVYIDHLEPRPLLEWLRQPDGGLGFAHVRRAGLLRQIAACVGTPDWNRKRAEWLALPRERERVTRTHRVVRRAPRSWWGVPNDPNRHKALGPWLSERQARAELGDRAV